MSFAKQMALGVVTMHFDGVNAARDKVDEVDNGIVFEQDVLNDSDEYILMSVGNFHVTMEPAADGTPTPKLLGKSQWPVYLAYSAAGKEYAIKMSTKKEEKDPWIAVNHIPGIVRLEAVHMMDIPKYTIRDVKMTRQRLAQPSSTSSTSSTLQTVPSAEGILRVM